MSRPRLLYVPIAAAVEAERFLELVDWADVAVFDAPGAGSKGGEESRGVAGIVEAALTRLDELGWESFGIVCDGHSQAASVEVALRRRESVQAFFAGHAAARYGLSGDRPAMEPAMHEVASRLLATDYRSFARALTQMTQGLADDAYVESWIREVPQAVAQDILGTLAANQPELVARLRGCEFPIVLGMHKGCVMWSQEAFEDACKALPGAVVVECEGIPTHDDAFLEAMRQHMTSSASS